MEEILASIRRIISEDDAADAAPEAEEAPVEEPAEPVAAAAPEPVKAEPVKEEPPEPPVVVAESHVDDDEDDDDDDALELTEKVETHGDLDVFTPPPAAPQPEPEPEPVMTAPPPAPQPAPAPAPAESLVSAGAAAVAAAAFGRLSSATAMPPAGRSLEDVVRELLRPMMQQWLDENLPSIVQRAVDTEVARIARGG
jgi:cell pole-organizing protein PopZ